MAVTTSWTKQTIAPSSSWTEDLDVVSTTWSKQAISPSSAWTETLEQFKFWADGNIFWQNVTNNYEDL